MPMLLEVTPALDITAATTQLISLVGQFFTFVTTNPILLLFLVGGLSKVAFDFFSGAKSAIQ